MHFLALERRSGANSVRFHPDHDEALILVRFDEHQDRLPTRLDGVVDFGLDLGR